MLIHLTSCSIHEQLFPVKSRGPKVKGRLVLAPVVREPGHDPALPVEDFPRVMVTTLSFWSPQFPTVEENRAFWEAYDARLPPDWQPAQGALIEAHVAEHEGTPHAEFDLSLNDEDGIDRLVYLDVSFIEEP